MGPDPVELVTEDEIISITPLPPSKVNVHPQREITKEPPMRSYIHVFFVIFIIRCMVQVKEIENVAESLIIFLKKNKTDGKAVSHTLQDLCFNISHIIFQLSCSNSELEKNIELPLFVVVSLIKLKTS